MEVLTFPGAEAVLAAQSAALPQPDQLCGPFAAYAALHAVLDPAEVPSVVEIAVAAGTAIWPHDVREWRPAGAPLDRTGWDRLPSASSVADSGTDAAGLARAVATTTRGTVEAVPATGATGTSLLDLLTAVAEADVPLGVVANVRTGPLAPDAAWDVGHFVVLWGLDVSAGVVAVADTYRELGAPDSPPGCRWAPLAGLADALAVEPGRGVLLLAHSEDVPAASALVAAAGLGSQLWST